jgi:DNA-binding LacI/PurR family transcriptional regulator
MVDPEIPGYLHDPGRGPDPSVSHQDWLSEYALGLAPEVYRRVFRIRHLKAFIVNDPRTADVRLKALDDDRVPYVVLGSPEHLESRSSVDIDDSAGFEAMTAKLLAAGCRRSGIAHYGFTDDGTLVPPRRRAGVARALGLREGAVPRLQRHYEATNDDQEVARLSAWLRDQKPQAVVCDSDVMAALVGRAASDCGRRVRSNLGEPAALLLAGCDDDPIREFFAERWMTLRQPAQLWARSAVQLLAEAISGTQPQQVLVSPVIVDPPGPTRPADPENSPQS